MIGLLCLLLQDADWKQYNKGDRLTLTWTLERTYKGNQGLQKKEYKDIREIDAVLTCNEFGQFKVEIKSAKWQYTPDGEHRITLTMDASGDIREEENTMFDKKAVREKFSKWLKDEYTWSPGLVPPSPNFWSAGEISGLFDWTYAGERDLENKLTPDTSWKRKLSDREQWIPAMYLMSEHKNKMLCRCRKENDTLILEGEYKLDHSKPYQAGDCTGTETIRHEVKNEVKASNKGLPLWAKSEIQSRIKRETNEEILSYDFDYTCRQHLLIKE